MPVYFVRDVDPARAKEQIQALLETSPGLDELGLSARLGIDFKTVCTYCDELVKSGAIRR